MKPPPLCGDRPGDCSSVIQSALEVASHDFFVVIPAVKKAGGSVCQPLGHEHIITHLLF